MIARVRAAILVAGIGAVAAACAGPGAHESAFVLPTLKVEELRRLVSDAAGDPAHVFARVVCEAKGLRFGGPAYGRCEDRLRRAAREHPDALERTHDLARLADRLSEATAQAEERQFSPGRASLCYDLARSSVTDCEDI